MIANDQNQALGLEQLVKEGFSTRPQFAPSPRHSDHPKVDL
jgi:hypothetical protein